MLSTIHSERIKAYLTGKVIDLSKYNYVQYKIYNYNEDNVLELNIKPLIELIQILQQIGYIWSNGLGLHINNFSTLTEQGKLNREILKTHKYILFENGGQLNLAYNFRAGRMIDEDVELISIEDVISYYLDYRIEKIGIDIMPDYRDIMIGDCLHIINKAEKVSSIEIIGFEYERSNSFCPSRYKIKYETNKDIKEYTISYIELTKILREEKYKVLEINRVFQGKQIVKYKRM